MPEPAFPEEDVADLGPVDELAPIFPNVARDQRLAPGAVKPTDIPASSATPDDRSWGDVPLDALGNLPGSAVGLAEGLAQPILHPIDTLSSIGQLVGTTPGTTPRRYSTTCRANWRGSLPASSA